MDLSTDKMDYISFLMERFTLVVGPKELNTEKVTTLLL